ncbi:hypothetical protein NE237_022422 [Protea cynaroides]|uniref:Uncharacterized protein n=1 Tax=Protea cynaroides TaxID=273540 RepID=A0A9Q0HD10_9MAGN|nr:hypothetical protein NE237_022422 [Protea cynaroides]
MLCDLRRNNEKLPPVTDRERFQEVFDKLEAQKNLLITCSELWKNLLKHFSSLEECLLEKSKSLDVKIRTLDSETKKTLEALEERENSIPEHESVAIVRVEEQKAASLSNFEHERGRRTHPHVTQSTVGCVPLPLLPH